MIEVVRPSEHARAVEMSLSSTFSTAVGATELMRGWNVAEKLARLALSNVAERGIGSRGHTLEGIDNGDPL